MNWVVPFSIGGFRSFGPRPHRLPCIRKVNFVAGGNNSGKSNVLLFLDRHYSSVIERLRGDRGPATRYDELDRHIGPGGAGFTFGLGMTLGGPEHEALRKHKRAKELLGDRSGALIDRLLEKIAGGGDTAWFDWRTATLGGSLEVETPANLSDAMQPGEWQRLWSALTNQGQGSLEQHWIPETFRALIPKPPVPRFARVEAVRQVGPPGADAEGFSGIGLINRLAQLQNPPHDRQNDKKRFALINQFVQSVIGDASATIEIPYARDVILVHQHGRVLPLANLGTGVHEVVILAAAATVLEDHVLCIEEPELHLHPILQRKLLEYLGRETTNQYFISTHSAHLLDTPGAAVYHVTHDSTESDISLAATGSHRFEICRSLGYLASDLLQANCVIWVEGPSDRIYLNHWLAATCPDLVEGVHYSIMLYGGRLLSHLTADDEEVSEFIGLRRLNRHLVMVIDSDIASQAGGINDTKKRVVDEIATNGGVVWVTQGRTIENYVPPDILGRAILAVHPRAVSVPRYGRWDIPTRKKYQNGRISQDVDKVKVSRRVCEEPASLEPLDLSERVNEVAEYIRRANDPVSGGGSPE